MESKQNNDESGKKIRGDLPLHFRLMDVFLEQFEQSAPLLTTMVKDMQAIYVSGVHFALKAGEMLEDRSSISVNFFHGAGKTFDSVTPVITETQLGVTKAIVDSTCQSIQLLRKSITGRK